MGNPTNHKNHTNHSSDNPLPAPSCPSWIIPVIPTAHPSFRRRPESRGAGTWGIPPITKITRITVQTTPFAPLRVLRGQSPSFQPPTRHSGGGRNPEGRGRGESQKSHESHESQFRQLPSRLAPFVDNPRHSNRPPVIRRRPVRITGTFRSHPNHSSDNPFASFVDNPRHSNRPPVIPAAAGIQRGGDVGNPTNHKNHTNHSSDNPLRAPSRPSWTIPVIPTAHPSFRHAAGIQRGGRAGHPTNHKNHTNHSSDNPLRAP